MRSLSSLPILLSAIMAVAASTAQAGAITDYFQSGESTVIHEGSYVPQLTPTTHILTNSIGCPRTYGGFDFAILQANVGGISGSIAPLGISGTVTPTFNLDIAPRIYFGRERSDGLGLRLTYFHYDHTTGPSQLGVDTRLQVQSLDVEATSRIQFHDSDLLLSAGFRYGKLMHNYQVTGLGSLGFDSEGGGLTIGGRYTRGIGHTCWDLFIGGRASILLTDNEIQIPGLISIIGEESTMKVWEGQVGVGRTFDLYNRADLVTEVSFEAQNWDAAAIAGLVGNDISLFGPTFRIGLSF
ncbi:hypothetical protein [Allorhodopirellula heiligendammensis]|uniref:Uncharacterized protein n=1 Tax=Allorhodopirellula heiligendammensis TaxID=2714739 RepID=A0A5C6C6M1_9BACT|nr:hypothetical protein [Allorhodopirellula heiligendammensis]TWU19131.1 hypothetical protein Poly21_13020 [Allorhodopirellula heiligendammensis]